MNHITVRAELAYDVLAESSFVFALIAARTDRQRVLRERIAVEPALEYDLVGYGEAETHQLLRLDVGPGSLTVAYEADVALEPDVDDPAQLTECRFGDVPADVLSYLNPSRYCESDRLSGFAGRHFGHLEPGFGRVASIRDWVRENLLYVSGSTDSTHSAVDVLVQRVGVCRDFAHVTIALCRALGIPARYVAGYGFGVEPPDFHGFVEVFLSQGWYLLDPTGMAPPNGLVRAAYGQDAADAAFATFAGVAELTAKRVEVTASLDATDPEQPTSTA